MSRLSVLDQTELSPKISNTGEKSENLTLSPNPSSGEFDIKFFLEKGKKAKLNVIDIQGKIIYEREINGQGAHLEKIRLSNKYVGTFLVQVLGGNGKSLKKVVVSH